MSDPCPCGPFRVRVPVPAVPAIVRVPASVEPAVVRRVERGDIGPEGPPGSPGVSLRHEHYQPSAAVVWTVAHNLGARPLVTVLTTGGVLMMAGILHLSENTLQVVLDDPQAGFAICA